MAVWPLLEAVRRRGAAARLGLGALAGLVWGTAGVAGWLTPAIQSHLAPTAAPLLAIAAGWLYGGVYLCALAWIQPWLPRPSWLMTPSFWVLAELLRGRALGGNPWALFGHTQHGVLPLAQLAEITGVAGLSFLVLMPSAALAARGRERRQGLLVWSALLVLVAAFGFSRLASIDATATPATTGPNPIRLVALSGHNLEPEPLEGYFAASREAPASDVTIWPENAVAGYLQEMPVASARLARLSRTRGWLLLGGHHTEGRGAERRYFNAALLLDPAGGERKLYAKSLLVPFAERSPWPFPSLVERPFSPGPRGLAPLDVGDLRLGVLICWESVFAEPALHYARSGAQVLVNLTSDRDLGAGVEQLLAFSRFRAIETRRWLIRASGTGPTRLIDPAGRILLGDTLAIDPNRQPAHAGILAGFYLRHGEFVPPLAALLLLLGIAKRHYERRFAPRGVRRDGVEG